MSKYAIIYIIICGDGVVESKSMKDAEVTVLSVDTLYITNTGRSKLLKFIGNTQ